MNFSKEYPHKKAKLVKGKRWYLTYGIWDDTKEKIIIKKWYKGFSSFKNDEEREKYALQSIAEINKYIKHACINKVKKPNEVPEEKTGIKRFTTVKDACEYMIDLKYNGAGIDSKSSLTMRSCTKLFIEWLKGAGLSALSPKKIQNFHVQAYIDHLVSVEKLAPKTIYNRYTSTRALFSKMLDRGLIDFNPFIGKFDMPKVEVTKTNFAYNADQVSKLKNWFLEHNPNMWTICQFIYYTYMRPIEVRRLKVKHILLEQNKIYVPAQVSRKSKKDAYLEIPFDLKNTLNSLVNRPGVQPNHFLFTTKWVPGENQIGYNFFAKKHKEAIDALGLDKEYTLYSWKHTGVVNAYKAGVDIKSIQLQCRHSSIEQTDTYLKSLGFVDNDSFSKGIPKI